MWLVNLFSGLSLSLALWFTVYVQVDSIQICRQPDSLRAVSQSVRTVHKHVHLYACSHTKCLFIRVVAHSFPSLCSSSFLFLLSSCFHKIDVYVCTSSSYYTSCYDNVYCSYQFETADDGYLSVSMATTSTTGNKYIW